MICYPGTPRFTVNTILTSDDGGDTSSGSGESPCPPRVVTYDPISPFTAYAAGKFCASLLRSVDGGRTWYEWDPSGDFGRLLAESPGWTVATLVVDPRRPSTIYALATNSDSNGEILVSRNSGQTWSVLPGPERVGVTAIALDATGGLIVGTTNGVFVPGNPTRVIPPR